MLKLNGLYENKSYEVYDIDCPEKIYTLTGKELMNGGIELNIEETPKASVIKYRIK